MSPLDFAARLSRVGKLDPRRLSRVLEYVHAHMGDDLDIRGMASAASLSRFHFARAFKASTGQTPYEYVSAKRLAQAKVLLAQSQRGHFGVSLESRQASTENRNHVEGVTATYVPIDVDPSQRRGTRAANACVE